MRLGRVMVDGGGRLRAEVSGFGVKVECAHAVGAVCAGKFHAVFYALDLVGFHCLNCTVLKVGTDGR